MFFSVPFKSWLVPGELNSHHPHLLRHHGLGALLLAIISVQLVSNILITGTPKVLGFATDINSARIYDLINEQRQNKGLAPLSINDELTVAAQAKAQDMLSKNYWAHISPTGHTPWQFITQSNYSYDFAGENLAKDFNTSQGVMSGWMASAEHKANVLSDNYSDIGVAVQNGKLEGEDTTLVVTLYGAPKQAFSSFSSLFPPASADSEVVSAPSTVRYNLLNMLPNNPIGWANIAIIALLGFFIIIYLNDYRVKIKFSLPRAHHSHSLLQAVVLSSALILIIVNVSLGMVG